MHSIWEEAAWQEWPAWRGEEGSKSYSEVPAVSVLPGIEKKKLTKIQTQRQPPAQNLEPALLLVAGVFWAILPGRDVSSVKCSSTTSVFINSRSGAVV